jgi:protease-4
MSLETDLLLDRRRLKRRLAFWRTLAVLAVVAAIIIAVRHEGVDFGGPRIARLAVSGLITQDRKLTDRVRALGRDPAVKAVIVEINSPGGSVAGGESLHDAIAEVAARKPVVAVMDAIAASAGYMVAVPAAHIFARQATITGSIGVLLPTVEVSGLLKTLGVSVDDLTSGPLKDQPSFTKPMTPEGRAVMQGIVMDMYDQFVTMVAVGRHMEPDKVRALADGRAYTGRQALKLGLIDAIGGERDARAWLAANRQVPLSVPVEDMEPRSLTDRMLGESLSGVTALLAKTLFSQGLMLDGPWAVWQPPRD